MADIYADHENLGAIPDESIVPALVNPPVIFIAPSYHTVSSGELWIAVSCPDNNYGGCVVWVSNTGGEYREIKRLEGQAIMGVLSAALPAASGEDLVNTLSVDFTSTLSSDLLDQTLLESVGAIDFSRNEPLCYAGGELLAFKTAALVDVGQYDLTDLNRGLYGSVSGAALGSDFVLLKDGFFRYKFNQHAVGGALYFKFQGFNQVGGGLQDLADCVAYSIMLASDGGIRALISDIAAPDWASITGKPTTISGYGITDAAPLASPGFTGLPTAPTAAAGTNTTQIATTAFTQLAIADLVASSPATLDTLNELAAALGNDANFSSTITASLAGKANLAGGNTFTGGQILSDSNLSRADLVDCSIKGNARGSISGTTTQNLDYESGSTQTVTIVGGAHTFAFSNWPSSGNLGIIHLYGSDMGLGTFIFPSSVWFKLKNDTFTQTFTTYAADRGGAAGFIASGLTILKFFTVDGGTTIYCEWM